jgi:hypothetical protein
MGGEDGVVFLSFLPFRSSYKGELAMLLSFLWRGIISYDTGMDGYQGNFWEFGNMHYTLGK